MQIRKATDLLDVEWETLLPDVPQIFPQDPSPEMLRQRRESNQVGESFQNRISRMLEAVIIPESEYSKALTVMESIRMMMAGLTGRGRALQVDMFRNWYLQFRSTFRSNFLLIHVHYLEGKPRFLIVLLRIMKSTNEAQWMYFCFFFVLWFIQDSTSKGLSFITASQIQDIITRNKNTFKYSDTRHLIAGAADCEGYGLTHQQSGMGFGLVIAPSAVAEVQRSRLLQFYCKFDPRIKPLLGIVHLWARINNIRFGETNIQFSHTHCHVPDPGALEWFVVFFLCDKWLIPTPREVQEQPHRSITYRNNLVDMGFTEDEQFASNWSTNSSLVDNDVDNAMLDLLTLAGEFFAFVYNISVNCQVHPCILNTRDAEVLRKDFLQGTKKAELTTKLRPEEVSDLQEELSKQLYNFRNIIMMHPFNLRWRFSISNGYFIKIVTPRVKVVGEKLQSFVELRKKELDQRGQFSNKIKSINLDHLLLCRIVK